MSLTDMAVQKDIKVNKDTIFRDNKLSEIPDWGMLWVEQITSSTKLGRIGVLPISKSTWYQLVKKGLIPEGVKIIGKKVAWPVDIVKEIAQRMANGEFTNVDIWK